MNAYGSVSPDDSYAFRKCVEAIKASVPLAWYIEVRGLTKLRPQGLRLVGLCPLHEEKTPSFTVFENDSFYCFGCGEWGDVVSLHASVDHHDRQWTAMLDLSDEYGVELFEWPPDHRAWVVRAVALLR